MRGCGSDSTGSEQGPVMGACKHGKEPSGSIKDGKFLDQLNDHQLVKLVNYASQTLDRFS